MFLCSLKNIKNVFNMYGSNVTLCSWNSLAGSCLWQETLDFIPADLYPPNTPDLNLGDYRGYWCRNVCTLYKHLSAIPAAVSKDLTQRLIDTRASQSHSLIYGYGASISQNVIDEAVGQWKKRLRASVKTKDIPLNICLTKPSLFRATNSLMRKTR